MRPGPALAKIAQLLVEGGQLVLMWNRVFAITPSREDLAQVYADYPAAAPSTPIDPAGEAAVIAEIESHRFSVERVEFDEDLHHTNTEWVGTWSRPTPTT